MVNVNTEPNFTFKRVYGECQGWCLSQCMGEPPAA